MNCCICGVIALTMADSRVTLAVIDPTDETSSSRRLFRAAIDTEVSCSIVCRLVLCLANVVISRSRFAIKSPRAASGPASVCVSTDAWVVSVSSDPWLPWNAVMMALVRLSTCCGSSSVNSGSKPLSM